MKNYYKAYENRYSIVHNTGELWETTKPTKEVYEAIKKYKIKGQILDLGCGEGRDAIYLLEKGYNILALDYSTSAIKKCNELTNNKYINNFRQFDIFEDELNEKYDFIYSVAVVHMFLLEQHRKKYYEFIYNHLKKDALALIISLGNGKEEYKTNIEDAFKTVKRININTNSQIEVTATSCYVKPISKMIEEIQKYNLTIIEHKIVNDLPNFVQCEYFIVKKYGRNK